jgi:hypothetical protein
MLLSAEACGYGRQSLDNCHTNGSYAIHPSAWKGNSQKLNFRFTEFSEVQLSNGERCSERRVMSSSCSQPSPTKE